MEIAKVEPMTTTRALRGPFDYRLPEPMVEAGVGVGSLLMIPFGGRRMLGVVVGVAAESDLPPERLAEPLEAIEAGATPELVRLGLWVADRYCSTPPRGLALVLPPGSGTGRKPQPMRALTERTAAITDGRAAALDPAREGPRLGARQRAVLERLAADGELSGPRIRELAGADSVVLARLAERGPDRAPDPRGAPGAADRHRRRRGRGAAALAAAGRLRGGDRRRARRRRRPRERLLHGVTGSGKTEVYLAAIEAALERGRSAILLVPEIGLTPQTVGRVAARLGDRVAVLHSGLSEGERFDEWRRLRSGAARVCVGPRSAVFAPLADLGLIVVDEEHDPSYKQEGDPRYDARAVARRRAAEAGAVYLAGSADPAARELGGARPAASCPSGSTAGRCRRSRSSTCARCPGRPGRSTRGPARRWPDSADGGREGDRDAEPPRVLPAPELRVLRGRGELPELRRLARPAPRQRGWSAATTAATPSRCRSPARSAGRSRSPATAPGPSGSSSSSAS